MHIFCDLHILTCWKFHFFTATLAYFFYVRLQKNRGFAEVFEFMFSVDIFRIILMLTRHSRMWFLVSVRNTYRNLLYFVTLFENKGVKKCENISIISSKTKSLERYVISQNYLKKMTEITVTAMKSRAIPMGDWGSQKSDKVKLVRFDQNVRSWKSYGSPQHCFSGNLVTRLKISQISTVCRRDEDGSS